MKNRIYITCLLLFPFFGLFAQQVMMQAWYWDYPKTADGFNWADTIRLKSNTLSTAGITHIWFPPHSIASSGTASNGYDPQDLFIGDQTSGLGTRNALNAMLAEISANGMDPVADLIYNHRDGGAPEYNDHVEGWISNYDFSKAANGESPYPSDRWRYIIPIGGNSINGAGDYFFKVSSASQHPNFHNANYTVYMQTGQVGFQNLPAEDENEPNGGGDCFPIQPFKEIQLGVDVMAQVDASGCTIDEFKLTLNAGDFDPSGDTLEIYLTNTGGYSDHRVYFIWNASAAQNVADSLIVQTYTDFTNMPSGRGAMNKDNFKPNGNPTCLCGDSDFPFFFYDYNHAVQSTRDTLNAWTEWNWDSLGVRGLRLDAIKHFTPSYVAEVLNYMHAAGKNPSMIVGEWFSTNPAELNGWLTDVYADLDPSAASVIAPKIFDFNLRENLRAACDDFGYDARQLFNSGLNAGGTSGFNIVTFVNNHDFRDKTGFNSLVKNDPILAYAYILTNNQLGVPTIFYPDYYSFADTSMNPVHGEPVSNNQNLKPQIDLLIKALQTYIEGSSSVDNLSREFTPYIQNFTSGFANTSLIYQLSNSNFGEEVIVAINFAGDTLSVEHGINMTNLSVGDTLVDVLGRSADAMVEISSSSTISINIPPRDYTVFVKNGEILDACAFDQIQLSGLIDAGFYKAGSSIIADGIIMSGSDVTFQAPDSVRLNPDFELESGGLLEVNMKNCD